MVFLISSVFDSSLCNQYDVRPSQCEDKVSHRSKACGKDEDVPRAPVSPSGSRGCAVGALPAGWVLAIRGAPWLCWERLAPLVEGCAGRGCSCCEMLGPRDLPDGYSCSCCEGFEPLALPGGYSVVLLTGSPSTSAPETRLPPLLRSMVLSNPPCDAETS